MNFAVSFIFSKQSTFSPSKLTCKPRVGKLGNAWLSYGYLDSALFSIKCWTRSVTRSPWKVVAEQWKMLGFLASGAEEFTLGPEIRLDRSELLCNKGLLKSKRDRKPSISALLTMPKPLSVWITINCGKFWKRWEYQTTWPASWEICMQVRKQQLELDMKQRLVPNRKRSTSRLYIVTLLI